MNRIWITLVMVLFCLLQFSGSLNIDGVAKRHTRSAMPWRSLEASRKDNKRYSRIPEELSKSFDKIFLSNGAHYKARDKRAVGSDGNHTINLSLHNISDINLSEFLKEVTNPSQVTRLNLSINHLRQLNVSAAILPTMSHLSALDVSQNQLSTIDAVELTKLTTLNVSHNNLYKFATTGAAALLSSNNNHTDAISRTTVSSSSIQVLDLSCNKFNSSRNIVLYNLNNLQMLDLSCNALTTIDRNLFFNLSQLQNLDLSYNQVSELRASTFIYLTQLQVLNLSNNNISFIQNDTFIALPNLEYLDVSNNFIRADSIHALQGIPDLVALSLANNEQLSESLQGFVATWSLKEMDGSGTGLCHIPAALTQSVRILKLVDNFLQVIRCGDLDSYPLLQHLILSSNEISDIEDDALGRLEIIETLYLNDNQLKRIPVSLPSSLIDLHLENNRITEIQPQVLTGLKTLALLNLSGNKIIYLPGLPLPRLSRLNMRSCELESVNQELVKMSPYLRDLYLEGNPIRCADLLGIAEWATPCRDSETELATSTADDFFIHKWHNHACEKAQKTRKQKMDDKVCKEVIRDEPKPKNNKIIAKTAKKINGNNYFVGNKEVGSDVVVANNKLIERQSSLNQQQQANDENREPDKNVNDKFENIDIIGKHDNNNNVNDDDDDDEQTMTLKRANKTIEGKSQKQTTKANITTSLEKLSNNNNIKTETTTEQTKIDKKTTTTTTGDNQIVAKKLIFDTSTLSPNNNHNTDKDQINERVQTNDVNQPIKVSKQKKVTKHWSKFDHAINMSSKEKLAKVTKSKTKVMAITNDDDYLNDDNKAVVDNFVTVSSQTTTKTATTTTPTEKKALEAKQLSLHFNFTKIQKASPQLLSSTTTAKPYSDRTRSVTQTTHNKINLDKHVQLNRKVNVLQQNSQLVTNYVVSEEILHATTTEPQQLQNTHKTEPHQTLNPILGAAAVNSDNEVESLPPQKQEWSDIRTVNDDISPYSSSSHFHSYLGHPGLFMVIGATIGMAAAFGFVHLYRCQKLRHWQHEHVETNGDNVSDISTINTPTHRCRHHNRRENRYHDDLLPMDVLNHKSRTTNTANLTASTSLMGRSMERTAPNSPIELW